MAAPNKPHGKSICPKVSFRCAKALERYISYCMYGDVKNSPTEEEERVVASFLKNLRFEITWEEKRKAAAEERKSLNSAMIRAEELDAKMERNSENNT